MTKEYRNQYLDELNGIEATDAFKQRAAAAMRAAAEQGTGGTSKNDRVLTFPMRRKRRMTLAAILAAALLLCAGTAFAIFQSTADRVQEQIDEKSAVGTDELTRQAEAYADSILADMDPVYLAEGSAAFGDTTIRVTKIRDYGDDGFGVAFEITSKSKGVVYFMQWPQAQDAEIIASHEQIVDMGQDAHSFRLKTDEGEYAPYTKAEEGDPAAWINEQGEYIIRFYDPNGTGGKVPALSAGKQWTLTGTLNGRDKNGKVVEKIGDFTIPFTVQEDTAYRAQLRQAYIGRYQSDYQGHIDLQQGKVDALPQGEAVTVGASDGKLSVNDVTRTEDSLLFGVTAPDNGVIRYYEDGYAVARQIMVSANDAGVFNEIDKVRTYTKLENLPEESLIGAEFTTDIYGEEDTCEHLVVFYYNWKNGNVRLPADAMEKTKWISLHESQKKDGRNQTRLYHDIKTFDLNEADVVETIDGTRLALGAVGLLENGRMLVELRVDGIRCELMLDESTPIVRVNGEQVEVHNHPETPVDLAEWKNVYWEWLDKKERIGGTSFTIDLPDRIGKMPEKFDLEIEWTLGDITQECERTTIGTYKLKFQIERDRYTTTLPERVLGEAWLLRDWDQSN